MSALSGNLSRWVLENMPQNMTPEWVRFLGEVMQHAADELAARKESEKAFEDK